MVKRRGVDLVIGAGEVGSAIYEVIREFYSTGIYDSDPLKKCMFDQYKFEDGKSSVVFMHICFPYGDDFEKFVIAYKEKFRPKYTIIHSTVPVGCSSFCGVTHSPIRGKHPFLADSIRIFTKFVGGRDADVVAEHFRTMGIRVQICRQSETTELAKIADTTFYAVCIEFIKELEVMCSERGVPFSEVFTLYQQTYNEGWAAMGYPEYVRPVLQPIQTKQGGHCTVSNLRFYPSKFAHLVQEINGNE